MKNKSAIFQLIAICFCFLGTTPFTAKGQYMVNANIEDIENVRKGTTYIVINHLDSPSVKQYIDVFKQYWTFSKIAFISYSEAQQFVAPGNSFFFLNYTHVAYYEYMDKTGMTQRTYNTPWTYLSLTTYVSNSKKDSADPEAHLISQTELSSSVSGVIPVEELTSINYGENIKGVMIKHWGAGFLKNYIQQLMLDLNKRRERGLYESIINERELKNLRTQTLYIPDYVSETLYFKNPVDVKKLFSKYKFDYQLISVDSLNKKILNDEKGFYYLMHTGFGSTKFITVANSKTGEVVYTDPSSAVISYNLKRGDLKALSKKIAR